MKRRTFMTLVGGAAVAWPLTAGAQQIPDGVAHASAPHKTLANPLEGKPLRYRIGTDEHSDGSQGEIVEVSYNSTRSHGAASRSNMSTCSTRTIRGHTAPI